jgi:hypothetical protein
MNKNIISSTMKRPQSVRSIYPLLRAFIISLFAFGYSGLGLVSVTNAADTVGISPVIIEKVIQPGTTYEDEVTVFNSSEVPVKIGNSVADFYYDNVGQIRFVEEEQAPISSASLKEWLSIDAEEFSLGVGEIKKVPVKVSVPADAEPGGHYGVLFFNSIPEGNTMVNVSGRVGTLVLVEVPGDVNKAAELTNFDIGDRVKVNNQDTLSPKSFFENGPMTFSFSVKNKGNVHFTPEGDIVIKNMFGRVVEKLSAQPENISSKYRSFPGVEREFLRDWEDTGFLMGRYTASLVMRDGSGNVMSIPDVSFTVFPWKFVIAGILFLLVLISLLVTLIKQYNKWIIKKAKKS